MANPDPGIREIFSDPPPSGGGAFAWLNPTRITANDGSASTITFAAGTSTSHYLKATNFGFSIPTNATILGVEVIINGKRSVAQPSIGRVYLYKGSVLTSSVKFFGGGVTTSNFPAGSFASRTFGDSTDMWSDTVLTPSDVNSSTFGVALKMSAGNISGTASTASCDISIDYITMKIYYSGGITVGASFAGTATVTLTLGRKYTFAYRNSATNHISDFAPLSNSTGAVTARNIPLSGISASTDPQVDRKVILATADGGDPSTLYLLAEIDNATTTLTDDVAEADLLTRNTYFELDDEGFEHGIADNTPPPIASTLPTKHRGRLYMVSGQLVVFSKSEGEVTTSTGNTAGVYEECWPADYFFDVSAGAEAPRALLSDGQTLYIGTEHSIHRLFGSGPEDFDIPEILFNDVGVLNQEVWQTCFTAGAPVGTIWLTPDFRVMGSDFNSYKNLGLPINALLGTINKDIAESVARAAFATISGYDLYFLAVPTGSNTTCDTMCVYDLASRSWVTWTLADNITSLLTIASSTGETQLLFGAAGGAKLYTFDPAVFSDRFNEDPIIPITCTVRTSWLDIGDPTTRKLLNEVEVMSGDPTLQLGVTAASRTADFSSPFVVKASSPLTTSPLGDKKLYLAGSVSRDRFYQLTFTGTGSTDLFVDGYSVEVVPFHRL